MAVADMNNHTVTVEFDDTAAKIEDVVKALGEAGFVATPAAP